MEASRLRPYGVSGEAPGELAFQHGEHEGSLGREGDDGSRTQHQAACTGMRTPMRRWWRLSGLDHMGCPAKPQRSRCSLEMRSRAGQVAAPGRPVAERHSGVQEEEAAIRPARRPSCKAKTCGFICHREAAGEAAQDGQSGFQEVAAPSAAKKGENGGATDESDLLTEDRD